MRRDSATESTTLHLVIVSTISTHQNDMHLEHLAIFVKMPATA